MLDPKKGAFPQERIGLVISRSIVILAKRYELLRHI